MNTKTIDERTTKTQQNVDFTEVLRCDDHKLRVRIRSNSYSFQCYAKIERWDGTQWHFLHGLGSSNMATPDCLYVKKNVSHETFKKDRDELVTTAQAILS